ncbi:hypothetical protein PBI_MELONS_71 [Arthrobacter phage Melons]|uniref:Uncharacterized protein n=1 Tax=Arthrobacter phage Melons TaxID=2419962 RepID=A0A3G2KI14_9CAUD|nr:hypothetical protein PBI_MELONS_71 [Arthrobacter phage Melons]
MAERVALFALVRHPERPSQGMLCKLSDDGVTHEEIAVGPWEKLKDVMDYLHEGAEALHGGNTKEGKA